MMSQEVIRAHAVRAVVDDRIHELLVNRRWYHANRWAVGPFWDQYRAQERIELQSLIRIARKARDLARPAEAFLPDLPEPEWDFPPDTTYASMTESEARVMWGNR